jgi:hypothetical protein
LYKFGLFLAEIGRGGGKAGLALERRAGFGADDGRVCGVFFQ